MNRFRTDSDPREFLPLTPVAFEILLSLAEGEQHGYSIMRTAGERSGGAAEIHAGTLYRALSRLLSQGLIVELDERPAPELDDERRRYYRITPFGRKVARAEVRRLAQTLALARARGFAPKEA